MIDCVLWRFHWNYSSIYVQLVRTLRRPTDCIELFFPIGSAGKIIQRIMENFEVSAMQMVHMEQANAEEFYEVYKGVVQEYPEMVKELTSGPCIAMEIKPKGGPPAGQDDNTAKSFREFAGPADPVCTSKWLTFGFLFKSSNHEPLARYIKLRVAHAPWMPLTFSLPLRVSNPDMHHGTCVTHVLLCMPGSLTSIFLWSRWRGKRSWRNQQFYVSGKRPMIRSIVFHFICLSVGQFVPEMLLRSDYNFLGLLCFQEIARHLRSHTLRAQFGVDKVKNGLHCTDLPEDGLLEVRHCCHIESPKKNGCHFADDIFKCFFLNESYSVGTKISLKFVLIFSNSQ